MSAFIDSKLAIDGGAPVRSEFLPYGRQSISEEDIQKVSEALRSNWVTRGPQTKAFEEAIAEKTGFPHAVAFTSATAGLHALMHCLGLNEKASVLVPAITFAATANAVRYVGAKVVFGDIDPRSMNLSVDAVKKAIDCKVIAAVDFAGQPCEYEKLYSSMQPSQRLVVDAAHSLGAQTAGASPWSEIPIAVFSFHPVKSITTGEGGVVVVREAVLAEQLRLFRNHGLRTELRPGFSSQEFLGFNYHMTEMQAALGISQLQRLEIFMQKRNKLARLYAEALGDLSEYFELPRPRTGVQSAWHLYALRMNLDHFRVDRDQFLTALRAENIGAQVHYIPVYWHPYYQSLGYAKGLCPIAEAEYRRELSLPLFPDMTESDLGDVVRALKKLVKAYQN